MWIYGGLFWTVSGFVPGVLRFVYRQWVEPRRVLEDIDICLRWSSGALVVLSDGSSTGLAVYDRGALRGGNMKPRSAVSLVRRHPVSWRGRNLVEGLRNWFRGIFILDQDKSTV